MIGIGSQYAWNSRDSAGGYLDGAKSYRLNLPANSPARTFGLSSRTTLKPDPSCKPDNRSQARTA